MTADSIQSRQSVDPVFRSSLRECVFILLLWLACCLYTVTYCYLSGYLVHEAHPNATGPSIGKLIGPLEAFDRHPQSLTTPFGLGVPDWVFYGVITPWAVAVVITVLFCLYFFSEEDLSPSSAERDQPGKVHD